MTNWTGETMWLKTGIIYPLATTFFPRAALCVGNVLFIWFLVEKRRRVWKKRVCCLSLSFLYQLLERRGCADSSCPGFGSGRSSVMGWAARRFRIAADKALLGTREFALVICALQISMFLSTLDSMCCQ